MYSCGMYVYSQSTSASTQGGLQAVDRGMFCNDGYRVSITSMRVNYTMAGETEYCDSSMLKTQMGYRDQMSNPDSILAKECMNIHDARTLELSVQQAQDGFRECSSRQSCYAEDDAVNALVTFFLRTKKKYQNIAVTFPEFYPHGCYEAGVLPVFRGTYMCVN